MMTSSDMMHCCRLKYPTVVKMSSSSNIYSSKKQHVNVAVMLIV